MREINLLGWVISRNLVLDFGSLLRRDLLGLVCLILGFGGIFVLGFPFGLLSLKF